VPDSPDDHRDDRERAAFHLELNSLIRRFGHCRVGVVADQEQEAEQEICRQQADGAQSDTPRNVDGGD
jgi:hypothetical protein